MKLTVISGGTGSISLKKSLSDFIPIENLYTLVNAYDNGLSTGLVRKVFNGDVLGPSDVRKQQLLDYILYKDEIKTELSEMLYEVLSKRYTFYSNPKKEIFNVIEKLPKYFKTVIENYFNYELANKIRYVDFSLANIIYASIANMNNNSLQTAADIIATYLNLPKNIIINSDESLFLSAITENNFKIYDEAEIVEYNNKNDRINDVFLIDKNGNEKVPKLSKKAENLLKTSDLIVSSAGTQFSSLIPTYKTEGFLDIVRTKLFYIVMNLDTDNDMTGYSLKEQYNIIKREVKDYHNKVFFKETLDNKSVVNDYGDCKHNNIIGFDILNEYFNMNPKKLFIDYDDTIMSRDIKLDKISYKVLNLISDITNSDTIKTVLVTGKSKKEIQAKMNVYLCNYGCTKYYYSSIESLNKLSFKNINKITDILRKVKFPFYKYENRNNTIISLRFLDNEYKELLYEYLKDCLSDLNLLVIKAGKSTIDIMNIGADNKFNNLSKFEDTNSSIYIGDEKNGNDASCAENMKFIEVKSPYDTYTILKYLLKRIKNG